MGGAVLTDDLTRCEGCDRHIGPTEEYYPGMECSLCVQCAPTWAEELDARRDQADDAAEAGDDEWSRHWTQHADDLEAQIAAGLDPDAKAVWRAGQPDVVLQ